MLNRGRRLMGAVLSGALLIWAPLPLPAEEVLPPQDIFRTLYQTDFERTLEPGLVLQAPTEESLSIVESPLFPQRNALRASMRRDQDFSRVANGSPRAEISFERKFRFRPGREYFLRWSTFLPTDFPFDSGQSDSLAQIHQKGWRGLPPITLFLRGDEYWIEFSMGAVIQRLAQARPDRGRWVEWGLQYRPDAKGGGKALFRLFKDGRLLYKGDGLPNAYRFDYFSYFKLGVYKPHWKSHPTAVEERTVYFGHLWAGIRD